MELMEAKYRLKKATPGSSYVEHLTSKVERLTEEYAQLKGQSAQSTTPQPSFAAPKPKKTYHDAQRHYYEVEINGEIFLECTSCSADGPGNCGCWLVD